LLRDPNDLIDISNFKKNFILPHQAECQEIEDLC
jgi:hypothetical protein